VEEEEQIKDQEEGEGIVPIASFANMKRKKLNSNFKLTEFRFDHGNTYRTPWV